MSKHFFSFLEDSIKKYWDRPVVSDFDGEVSLTYSQLTNEIFRLKTLFDAAGIKKGDKIALCGNNCAYWALSYMAVTTHECVVVSILPDFTAESVQSLVTHSDAKLFIVGPKVWQSLDFEQMPHLKGVLAMWDFSLLACRDKELSESYNNWGDLYKKNYPNGVQAKDVHFPKDNMDDLCLINYTSGTTSAPKGVMLTYRSISSNVEYGLNKIPCKEGDRLVSMLPLAHMFGLAFEFIYPMAGGCHIHFLNKMPTPQVLLKAFSEVKPYLVITVPLVVEKIFKNAVFPKINKPIMKILWNLPGVGRIIKNKVKDALVKTFGGQLYELIVGGAALSGEVERCMKDIRFPYTVGYGMTECGPLITYNDWHSFEKKSCGKIVDRMTLKIDSNDPEKEVGEIMVKGDNVMLGYYKNDDATHAVLNDGWLRTGDLGIVDKKGNLFIKGRSKSMILGQSGQNIYPEEIEDKINAQSFVIESVVVQRENNLVALIFPDYDNAKKQGIDRQGLEELMQQNLVKVNRMLPHYCRVAKAELVENEFSKTPKRSIKRFLYN